MPFRHVNHDFQPEQLEKMTKAFELAWPEVLLARGAGTPNQLEWLRRTLATYIIAKVRAGESDPQTLKEAAVRAFSMPRTETPDIGEIGAEAS